MEQCLRRTQRPVRLMLARLPDIYQETDSVTSKIQSGYSFLSKIVFLHLEDKSNPDAGGVAPGGGRGKIGMVVSQEGTHLFPPMKLLFLLRNYLLIKALIK